MKLHLVGHVSRHWGTLHGMCKFTAMPGQSKMRFTTLDQMARQVVKLEDVCKLCLKIMHDMYEGKRCCTDPVYRGKVA